MKKSAMRAYPQAPGVCPPSVFCLLSITQRNSPRPFPHPQMTHSYAIGSVLYYYVNTAAALNMQASGVCPV